MTLPAFAKDYHLDKKTAAERTAFASNVVSVFQAGAVFGAMASATVADRVGRKIALMGNLFIYLVGAVLMTAAGGSAGVGLVYAGRVLTGWGVGASTMLVPVYVAECSPPHIRGRLVGLYEVGVQFGTMVGFWIPYGVLKTLNGTPQWRIPFSIQMIPAFVSVSLIQSRPATLPFGDLGSITDATGLRGRSVLPHRNTTLHGPSSWRSTR